MTALTDNGRIDRVLVATDGSEYSAGHPHRRALASHAMPSRSAWRSPCTTRSTAPWFNLEEGREARARRASIPSPKRAGRKDGDAREATEPYQGIVDGARTTAPMSSSLTPRQARPRAPAGGRYRRQGHRPHRKRGAGLPTRRASVGAAGAGGDRWFAPWQCRRRRCRPSSQGGRIARDRGFRGDRQPQ